MDEKSTFHDDAFVARWIAGELTEKESRAFEQWIEHQPDEKKTFEELKQVWQSYDSVKLKKAPAAQEKMQQLLARFDMSSVTSHITAGPPDRTIPHQANELNSDLVIIGSVGREGGSGFLLGNTAEKVLHHLRTDCLIIKRPQD